MRYRFSKRDRVRKGDDFTDIIKHGSFASDDQLTINVRRASDSASLAILGISIPKKTGNAVVRNRWKRWIREAFRLQREQLPRGVEIIVRPKRDATGTYANIAPSLLRTTVRACKRMNQV